MTVTVKLNLASEGQPLDLRINAECDLRLKAGYVLRSSFTHGEFLFLIFQPS